MKKPIDGKFVLYYDETNYILKETFQLDEGIEVPEDRKCEIPKNRIYKLPDWKTFKKLKKSLNYESINEFAEEMIIRGE